MEDDIIKMDTEFIKLMSEAKYERRGSNLYCLNYAEPGMFGSSIGKIMPDHLAVQVLKQYKKETEYLLNKKLSKKTKKIKPAVKKVQKKEVKQKAIRIKFA